MMKVSCAPFTEREFDRLIKTLEADNIKPPTRAKLEKKGEMIRQIDSKIQTEAEIAAMLARQKEIRGTRSTAELYSQKSGLNTQRLLAIKRNQRDEVARLDAEISALEAEMRQREAKQRELDNKLRPAQSDTTVKTSGTAGISLDALSRVNERNRKANLEAMRKADLALAQKRKREAAGGATVTDLSARVKTIVKTRFDSRAGTPGTPGPEAAPPQPTASQAANVNKVAFGGRGRVDELAQSVIIEDLF